MPAIDGSTPSTGPNFRPSFASDERKANARGAAALMEERSATWATGAGGIARRSSGVTDAADHCGSYPRCGCGRGLSGRRAWSSPARISITTQRTTGLKPEGVLPTLSHAARPPGASAPALDDLVPAQSTRRPLPGSVSVAGKRTRHLKSGRGRRTKRDLT